MMNKIILLNNKVGKVFIEEPALFDELNEMLSFQVAGYEYTQAYRMGKWDGRTHLLNSKQEFPIGLKNKIIQYLKDKNQPYEIEDHRKPIEIVEPLDISDNLKKMGMTPRDYQEEIVACCFRNLNGIVRAATASGKSLVAAMLTAKINKPTIIAVISLDLISQFHNSFSKIFDEKIGFIGNGVCDIQRINIASIWTLAKALDIKIDDMLDDEGNLDEISFNESDKAKIIECLKTTKVHILDECHVAVTNTIRAIHRVIEPERIYGLSGTPFRNDSSDLLIEGLLGPKIIDVSASFLIHKGVLVQPYIKYLDVPKMKLENSSSYPSVYKQYIVENETRNNMILESVKDLNNKGYKILVLFKNIKHGNILAELFKKAKLNFEMLSGKDSLNNRNETKSDFDSGKVNIILASTIFDIGVSLDSLSSLVLAGGGKSSIRCLQRIGRIIRPYPGKKSAAVVEFYDNARYLSSHSMTRYNIYKSEDGFKVFPSPNMKDA